MTTLITITLPIILSIFVYAIHKHILMRNNNSELIDRIEHLEYTAYLNDVGNQKLKERIKDLESKFDKLSQVSKPSRPLKMRWYDQKENQSV